MVKNINMTKYRYFYHYYKQYICNTSSETKWNKKQPNLDVQGFAKDIQINEDNIVIL